MNNGVKEEIPLEEEVSIEVEIIDQDADIKQEEYDVPENACPGDLKTEPSFEEHSETQGQTRYNLLFLNDEKVEVKKHLFEHKHHATGNRSLKKRGPKSPFHCEVCSKRLPKSYFLKRDLGILAHKNPRCEMCEETVQNRKEVKTEPTSSVVHATGKRFQCKVCVKSYTSPEELKEHYRRHKRGKHRKCNQCPLSFYSRYAFAHHKFKAHGDCEEISCGVCGEKFTNAFRFESHVAGHDRGAMFNCGDCDRKSRTLKLLLAHIASKHAIRCYYQCEVCPRRYRFMKTLKRHSESHRSQAGLQNVNTLGIVDEAKVKPLEEDRRRRNPFQCKVCLKTFTLSKALVNHSKQRHGRVRTHKCDECFSYFITSSTLASHKLTMHSNVDEISCAICGLKFTSIFRFKIHMKRHNCDEGVKCGHCDKSFKSRSLIVKHMVSVHTSEKHFQCEVCSKRFSTSHALNTHFQNHNDSRSTVQNENGGDNEHVHPKYPFQCKMCSKTFALPETLENHSKTHWRVKTHKCNLCSSYYSTSSTLASHIFTMHSNNDEVSCTVCGKTFASIFLFKTHMKSHNCNEGVNCGQCEKSFKSRRLLIDHTVSMHTTEKHFQCEVCSKRFSTSSVLNRHRQRHNNIKSTLRNGLDVVDEVKVEPVEIYDPEAKVVKEELAIKIEPQEL